MMETVSVELLKQHTSCKYFQGTEKRSVLFKWMLVISSSHMQGEVQTNA